MRSITAWLILPLLLALLAGCAAKYPIVTIDPASSVVLEETPYYPQGEYQCGPAALAMLLGGGGVDVEPDDLAPQTYIPGRHGSLQIELVAACRRHARIPYILDGHISSIIDEIQAGRPVLVLQNIGLNIFPVYHYAVVIGVLSPDKLVLHSAGQRRMEMDLDKFLATWDRAGSWAMVALSPGDLPVSPDRERYLSSVAAFESSGYVSGATKAYRAAITIWPEDQTTLFALANNCLAMRKYSEAENLYKRLLLVDPGHIAVLNNLAETLVRQGRYAEAMAAVSQALGDPGFDHSPFRQTVLETEEEIKQAMHEEESVETPTSN